MIRFLPVYEFYCEDCHAYIDVHTSNKLYAFRVARLNGWAIARDRKTCYCPQCAKRHRNVGSGGPR